VQPCSPQSSYQLKEMFFSNEMHCNLKVSDKTVFPRTNLGNQNIPQDQTKEKTNSRVRKGFSKLNLSSTMS